MPANVRSSALVVILLVGCSALPRVTPVEETNTVLGTTHGRIWSFWKTRGQLPENVTDLPMESNRNCSTKDAWGREILWSRVDEGTIKLSSLGRDGNVGGIGEDADLVVFFHSDEPSYEYAK